MSNVGLQSGDASVSRRKQTFAGSPKRGIFKRFMREKNRPRMLPFNLLTELLMTDYWLLQRDETDVCVLFEKKDLGQRIVKESTNSNGVRRVFKEQYGEKSVPLILSGRYEEVPLGDPRCSIDVAFYGWISAFSARAYELLLAHGCHEGDFVPCHFTVMPELKFHSFLPQMSYDVVDVQRSKFHMILPMEPPMPVGISSLVFKTDIPKIPETFYATVPGYEMVFGELLVSNSFCVDWTKNRLTGASFKDVINL